MNYGFPVKEEEDNGKRKNERGKESKFFAPYKINLGTAINHLKVNFNTLRQASRCHHKVKESKFLKRNTAESQRRVFILSNF